MFVTKLHAEGLQGRFGQKRSNLVQIVVLTIMMLILSFTMSVQTLARQTSGSGLVTDSTPLLSSLPGQA